MYKVIRRYYQVTHGDITPKIEVIGWAHSPQAIETHVAAYKLNHPGWELDGSEFSHEDYPNDP